jgi:probable HAF family extracellular repeat protein
MRFLSTFCLLAGLSIGLAAQTLTTFVVNPEGGAGPTGINDNGDVVGFYGCGQTYCGFLRNGSTGVSKHLGVGVNALALNNSDEIVGTYHISAFYWPSGGKMVQFLRGSEPDAVAVNTAGYVTGAYRTNAQYNTFAAFLMNPQGQISTIFAPPKGGAEATAINNANQVVGFWTGGSAPYQGFVYTDGTVNSAISYPGAVATYPYAINDGGEIAGSWTDSVGFVHGFYWTAKAGFTSFDAVQNTTHTIPTCMNASGVVAGYYWTKKGLGTASFTYDTTSNTVTLLSIPHARFMNATGINTQGTVTGSYRVGTGAGGGFLYQP